MADTTSIEWTNKTFNPWIGCTKISPGCRLCYAADMSKHRKWAEWGAGKKRKIMSDENWKKPLRWQREAKRLKIRFKVFTASLADVFDVDAPASEQQKLFKLIEATPNLDWQILTKRPERVLQVIPQSWIDQPRENVWFGATVENADYKTRIDALRGVPAKVRFLSVEPLVGALGVLDLSGISWVIVGGETGPGATPLQLTWARDVRDQCAAQGVAFFFKQWGAHDVHGVKHAKHKFAGYDELDGVTHKAFPVGQLATIEEVAGRPDDYA